MPDTVVAPAPAAATPAPTPVTPPVPPVAPTPPTDDKSSIGSRLHKLLTNPRTDDDTPPKSKAEPEKPKAEPAPVAATKPEAKEPPIKVRKPKVTEETPPPVPKREPAVKPVADTPAAPAPKEPVDDTAFEKSLMEEEQVLLDDARAAERLLGDKYKGQSAKMLGFLKESAKKESELKAGTLDEQDYREWYEANRPKLSALAVREIERARVKEDVKKEFEPQIEQERQARWAEAEAPKIKAKGNEAYNKLANMALPDEMATAIAERTKGVTDRAQVVEIVKAVQKEYALESEIHESIVNAAANDIETFHRLTTTNPATQKPLEVFNPSNAQHQQIVNMVNEICSEFKTTGGMDQLKKDGKWFATREEWQGMSPEQRIGWWTFTNEQIIDRALGKVKGVVNQAVKAETQRLESRGFKRTVAAPPAAPAVVAPAPLTRSAPPAPRPSPAPSGGGEPPSTIGARLAGKILSQPQEQ